MSVLLRACSGSDLASAQTRAVRSETGWTVDGQKVWTSGAQRADRGMLLARTNRDVPFRDLTIGTQRPAR